jgi:signal transduction histidine kinase
VRRLPLRLIAFVIVVANPNAANHAAAQSASADDTQKRVLVLHQLRRDAPVSASMEDLYRRTLAEALGPRLDYYSEFLDLYRFAEPQYQSSLRSHLRERYGSLGLDLVIAPTTAALGLVRHDGIDDVLPGVPIVFHAGKGVTGGTRSTGVVSEVDIGGSLASALSLQPDLKHVVVITGAGSVERGYGQLARAQFKTFDRRVSFDYLDGQPMADIETSVAQLAPGSAVFYIGVSRDGAGRQFVPMEALARLVAVASVPVYSWHDTAMGHGIVGGRLFSSDVVAYHTANLALRVLRGEPPESIPVVQIDPYVTRFDGRQLARWKLDESRMPNGSAVLFRPHRVWDEYLPQTIAALAAIGVLTALSGTLWLEHRRRQRAEIEARRHLSTMAHLDRRAAMGQLTASLAHELHQPLSAILRNAEAAGMLIDSGASPQELREIINDIRSSDKRAAQIIQRMRSLLQKHELGEEAVDLNDVVRETMEVVAPDARARGVRVQVSLDKPSSVIVAGDRIHLQQILLNLVLNGFDAMAETPEDDRRLVVSTAAHNGHADLAVRDAGSGISEDAREKLFEPFFTTKQHGMGMGLSVVRSIVEAHNGRIEAHNNADRGATLRVSLPIRREPARTSPPFPDRL